MRMLRSGKFLAVVAVVMGLGIATWEQWDRIKAAVLVLLPAAATTGATVGVCLAVVSLVAGSILVAQRLVMGLICPVCGNTRLQHASIRPFGRRYYLCRKCGAHLVRHPVGSELVVMTDDQGVKFPQHGLRYPPAAPSPLPDAGAEARMIEDLEGPPRSLATLVKAKHDRKRGAK